MKKLLLFATSYPYTAAIIAVIWLASVAMLLIDNALSSSTVLFVNVIVTLFIAVIGFRR